MEMPSIMQTKPARFPRFETTLAGERSDQINAIRQLVAIRCRGRKMPCKLFPAHFDRGDKPLGNTAVARVGDQGVYGFLPSGLGHPPGDRGTDDNASIALGERNKDEDPRLTFVASEA